MRTAQLGPSVEPPSGAVKRCTGREGRLRAATLGPSVKLPMGPQNVVLERGNACELRHWSH
eukprot:8587027-Pyramimonas_sp.AAC.1